MKYNDYTDLKARIKKLEAENQRLIEIMEIIAMELHDQIKKKLQKELEK